MRSNVIFFLGLFAALGLSWAGIVLGSNAQLGALAPYFDASQETAFPQGMPGEAARGQLVYRDLGCAACHTQQVRRPGFGSDQARGWGERQSVARDYIYQPYPQLGLARVGPDLTNLGDRKPTAPDEDDLLRMLYAGSDDMPAYRFLFEERRVGSGAQRSDQALQLTGALEPAAGWEIVPTARARALVAYLVNLKTAFDYPEAIPYVPPQPEGAAQPKPPAAPANGPAPSAPKGAAAAPAAAGAAPASPPGANAPAPTAAPTAANPGPAGVSAPTPTAAPAGSQIPAA
ncbi:MAG TPA: cbb3-type cytochrome c oxidase subunit II, partial [Opitutaceae bacterium]|nr:cbb3-type cytochrome c oxidase subunit II [Opitutaceae bacterium]